MSGERVVVFDFLSGVATPVVVRLRLAVWVSTVVVLLGGVLDSSGITWALKVGWVAVRGDSRVNSLGCLVVSLVLLRSVAVVGVLCGVSDREESKSE